MKAILGIIIGVLFTQMAFAGYDFQIPETKVAMKLNDGTPISGAIYDYYVFAEYLQIPCMDDMNISGLKCWKGKTLDGGKITTDDSGEATLAAKSFKSNSSKERNYQSNPLNLSFWGVIVSFNDDKGIERKCVAVSAYSLYQAKINMHSEDASTTVLDINRSQYNDYIEKQKAVCVSEVIRIRNGNGGDGAGDKVIASMPYFIAN